MLDSFFLFITLLGDYALIWVVLAIVLALLRKEEAKKIVSSIVYSIAFSFLVTMALKLLFRAPRPAELGQLASENCPVDFSFPSGHASTSFAAAVVLARFDPKRNWLYIILAGLISYSRIYLSCHHAIDVFVGGVIGTIVSAIVLKISANPSQPVAKAKRSS